MRLRGRLGNQLFIYAFGRALQEKYRQPLILLHNENNSGRTALSELNIPNEVQIVSYKAGAKYDFEEKEVPDYERNADLLSSIKNEWYIGKFCLENHFSLLNVEQAYNYALYKLRNRKRSMKERFEYEMANAERLTKAGLFICENGYIKFPETTAKNIFGFGYFQSEEYFVDIKDKIKCEVQPMREVNADLADFAADIQNSNSVCLSIRMGDYINNPVMGVCTSEFYQKAIDYIYYMYNDARIFVFSDDVGGVKRKFHFQHKVVFEPMGSSVWEKLRYMSMCKHFIISNSSFSWWAQYLGEYSNKTVIAPEKWFAKDIPCDIQQNNWTFLPV